MKKIILLVSLLLIIAQAFAFNSTKSIGGFDLFTEKKVEVQTGKKGLVIVFLSAKCPCSNSHVTEIKELSKKYTEFSFVAVHSNSDENKDLSKPYFTKADFLFPVIEDKNTELADQFQAFKTPHAFVFLPSGELVYQGGVSNSRDCEKSDRKYLREALGDIQSGQSVKTTEGRTLGCSIFRGKK